MISCAFSFSKPDLYVHVSCCKHDEDFCRDVNGVGKSFGEAVFGYVWWDFLFLSDNIICLDIHWETP